MYSACDLRSLSFTPPAPKPALLIEEVSTRRSVNLRGSALLYVISNRSGNTLVVLDARCGQRK